MSATDLTEALTHLHAVDVSERLDAITTLASQGPAELVGPALVGMLEDPDVLVRAEAADALGALRYEPAWEAVQRLLKSDPSALVRACAAETLGDLGHPEVIPDLLRALRDEDDAVRGFAANSLGLLGTAALVPALESALAAEVAPSVRAELQGACYRLGVESALENLLEVLATMSEDLGVNVLNVWSDLLTRRLPPSLPRDAPRILAALAPVAARLPLLRGQADDLHARLRGLTAAPPAA